MPLDSAPTCKEPAVAVIIAAYNEQEYIQLSVSSALEQTYTNLEVIVVNDGSTDDTLTMLEPFKERVKIVNKKNSGPGPSRAAGVAVTDAEYIAFLDADDVWFPEKIYRQMQVMQAYPEVIFVGSSPWRIDSEGNKIKDVPDLPFIPDRPVNLEKELLSLGNLRGLGPSGCLIRRSAYTEAGGFRDVFAEDYELWIRLSTLGSFFLMSEPLYCYRVRARSLTHSDTTREFQCEIDILNLHRDKYNCYSRSLRLSTIHYKWADSLVYKRESGALKHLVFCLGYNPLNYQAYTLLLKHMAKSALSRLTRQAGYQQP